MKHLHKKGDVVNIFQMSVHKGLMFEGRATVLKPTGSVGDEYYLVRFHGRDDKPELGEEYERFVDRSGQEMPPEEYIAKINRDLNITAA
jgi:hypothetical protein